MREVTQYVMVDGEKKPIRVRSDATEATADKATEDAAARRASQSSNQDPERLASPD